MIADIVIIIAIALALGGAVLYMYRAKKQGQKCIGCPYSKECGKKSCDCESEVEG
ncbi:MAG: FeoB-associated Cys-rich membrane protein [Clostridia bacterium]|nr:FeoB-associated Cys-rich membrane protein [Clostridia bacterium]